TPCAGKFLKRTRQLRLDWLSVGGDKRIHGITKIFEMLLKVMSSASPNFRFGPAEEIITFVCSANLIWKGVCQISTTSPDALVRLVNEIPVYLLEVRNGFK